MSDHETTLRALADGMPACDTWQLAETDSGRDECQNCAGPLLAHQKRAACLAGAQALREVKEDEGVVRVWMRRTRQAEDKLNAGREAIALLRRYDIGVDMPDFGIEDWEDAVSALLARCEGGVDEEK